jgi:hypothetical protein
VCGSGGDAGQGLCVVHDHPLVAERRTVLDWMRLARRQAV